MKRQWILAVLAAATAGGLSQGCNKAGANSPTTGAGATNAAAAPQYPNLPTKAQPKLATTKLWVGKEEMVAEMAIKPVEIQTGMMFRTNMAENEGMIFVLSGPQRAGFWMMNCPMPLSAAYIDTDGKILEIRVLEPHNTNTVLATHDNVQFVLEAKQGWFERHNIKEGTVIATDKGSLKKMFLEKK